MRLIIGISLALLGIGTWSCRLDGLQVEPPAGTVSVQWVRTADGWERPAAWQYLPDSRPQLHPLVVAVGQALLSVLALAALCPTDPGGSRGGGQAAGPSRPRPA